MRTIDMQTWPRRKHFEFFSAFDHPHFNMCANMDLSAFLSYVKQNGHNFTVSLVYLIARTANDIPEFRQRIHANEVVEHEVVHPSTTILTDDEIFTFCTITYSQDFSVFATQAAERIAFTKENLTLEDPSDTDNLLFMTAIPWVSFTSFTHPQHLSPVDSVPRFAWGKIFQQGEQSLMPLSVQGHHALMDGLHMARYYATIQDFFHHPETCLA